MLYIGAGRDLNTWLWLCASKACMLGKGICLFLSRFCPYWTATLLCIYSECLWHWWTCGAHRGGMTSAALKAYWNVFNCMACDATFRLNEGFTLKDKLSWWHIFALLYSLFIEAGCKPAGEILEGRWDANPGHHLHSFHKAPRTTRVYNADMMRIDEICVLNRIPEYFAECLTSFQHWDWELWKHPFYWDWRLSGSQDMLWPRITEEWIKSSALYLGAPILASWPYWGRDMFSRDIGQMDANFRTYCDIRWPKIDKKWDDLSCLDVF